MEKKPFITVRSLALLVELSKAKCLCNLIRIEEDNHDPACRPVYRFVDSENVRAVVKQFIDKYGADDRRMDAWSEFYASNFYSTTKENTIATRNLRIANKIVEAGYAINLCGVFKDRKSHKKTFIFLANDEIKKIKTEGDSESAAWYAERMKDGEKNE